MIQRMVVKSVTSIQHKIFDSQRFPCDAGLSHGDSPQVVTHLSLSSGDLCVSNAEHI